MLIFKLINIHTKAERDSLYYSAAAITFESSYAKHLQNIPSYFLKKKKKKQTT